MIAVGIDMDAERVEGLRRWNEWLNERLSPHGVVRDPVVGREPVGALWRVSFHIGGSARIHVTEPALTASEERFRQLTARVNDTDWIRVIRMADGGIRIHGDGRVEELREAAGE